ncbi:(2Fe-2S) ferredoxin domain-containing protein [Fulvivirgaceae bacterium PWU5]|uniref:(2Fe-2S) ferredoxin domain-containing protein n=1 Tax=Dawidia cretensis TaxID=2782350 RepID=A0AAP2GWI6_9BACT|nr:(2Fe-2S) ferredoxin domain-containing protein [Dawidia cretensis]MBT1710697.1 (2Fe-2S) ferredoxin domain-containing protein [Dawidia cretensis]
MSKEFSRTPNCVFYVCCGSKCKKRGSKHLYKRLKSTVKEQRLRRKVQVIKTGCTDHCKRGPVVAVMPKNEWNFEVTEEKAMSLLEDSSQ